MAEELTYALLIDAENISQRYIKLILDELSNQGTVTYRRIYGDWTAPGVAAWKTVLLDHSITPIQQYSYTQGKNASDSAMIIDAMDILYSDNVGGFCLVSSDSDFTRLASRLRESNKHVIGMGESKTPAPFIAACNTFRYLDILATNPQEAKVKEELAEDKADKEVNPAQAPDKDKALKPMTNGHKASRKVDSKRTERRSYFIGEEDGGRPEPQTKLTTIRRSLRSIVADGSDEDGWMSAAKIGNQLAKRFPDFDVRNYGFSKLNQFIESLGEYETDVVRPTKNSRVQHLYYRLKDR